MHSKVFWPLWFFVGQVSAVDVWLNTLYRVNREFELNPVAAAVLRSGHDGFAHLVGLKFAGTLAALTVLIAMRSKWPAHALTVTATLAAFQAFVLAFLLATL